MMRFSPPTEITPEPTPEFVLNYDASCLPNVTAVPTPTPSPTPIQNEDESGMLVSIPPLEGEFSLLETGTMQQSQSNIIFLEVDTTLDDANLNACTDTDVLPDCSLRGAVGIARDVNNRNNPYVIRIPNDSYVLASELIVEGNVTLVGQDGYGTDTEMAGVFITNTVAPPIFYIRHFNETGISTPSNVTIYNITFQNSNAFTAGAIDIQSSNVNIYNSQFINNTAQWGGAISVDTQASPSSVRSVVEIKNGLFLDNTAVYIGGAMIGHTGGSITKVYCSIFEDNHANYGGGAIGASSYTSFSGQITVSQSNFINNTVSPSHPVQGNGGGAIHRTSGTVAVSGNYWSPDNPPSTTATASNSIMGVSAGAVNNQPFERDCDVPPPPTNQQTQCSDPNDFNKLKETNTNLADREACWMRYAGIIYLTIHHEFSLDNALVFNPSELSTQLFQYSNDTYDGRLDTGDNGLPPELFITSRTIQPDELTPFDHYDNPYTPYYLFARALLNGMGDDRYLIADTDGPMRYFIKAYNSTIGEHWTEIGTFCGGNQVTTGPDAGLCFDEDWYSQVVQNNYTSKLSYQIVKPHIDNAICHMVYGYSAENCGNFDDVGSEPEWMSHIFSVVPANFRFDEYHEDEINGEPVADKMSECFPQLGPPHDKDAYVFQTYVGYLWQLIWTWHTSGCSEARIFHALSMWDANRNNFTPRNELDGATTAPDETLSQAYMRHLRELYGNQTFNRVICGEPISIFTNTMTRFGENQRAMMMPVLSVEFYPPTLADEQNQIRQIVWYHYRFYLPARDKSPIMLDLPSKANRTISESELIIFEEINGELKPLEPLPQPANPRLCP